MAGAASSGPETKRRSSSRLRRSWLSPFRRSSGRSSQRYTDEPFKQTMLKNDNRDDERRHNNNSMQSPGAGFYAGRPLAASAAADDDVDDDVWVVSIAYHLAESF